MNVLPFFFVLYILVLLASYVWCNDTCHKYVCIVSTVVFAGLLLLLTKHIVNRTPLLFYEPYDDFLNKKTNDDADHADSSCEGSSRKNNYPYITPEEVSNVFSEDNYKR